MTQKFKFNFSFLDRFKKKVSPPPVPQDYVEEEYTEEEVEFVDEEQNAANHQEDSDSLETLTTQQSEEIPSSNNASEYDSDISPEEFAAKTLGGFDLEKHRQQLEAIKESLIDPTQPVEEELEIHPEDIDNFSQDSNIPFEYKPPEILPKTEIFKKFTFKFPKFNSFGKNEKLKEVFSKQAALSKFEKFNWNDFVLKLFSPYSRGKIHSVFIIFLVVTFTYLVGKNIALIFTKNAPITKISRSAISPQVKSDSTTQDLNKIVTTNLFNAKESDKGDIQGSKKDIDSIVCTEAQKPTSLDIKLLNTIVLQDSVKSIASVQVRGSSDLMNVRQGDKLDQLAEVSKIDRLKVILKNLQTGDCEFASAELKSDSISPGLKIISAKAGKSLFRSINPNIKNDGNSFKIKKQYRDSMINNMNEVLTQAKAIQITNPDGSMCFKMTEVVAGSIYSQLNIQENDIVCNINGKKIENLNELMGLLGRVKEIDQFQIGLKRNGINENLDYSFE